MRLGKTELQQLHNTYLFQALNDEQLELVLSNARYAELQSRQNLFTSGQKADRFYLLLRGQIKLFSISEDGVEKVLEIVFPGQTFAEAIMFMENRFTRLMLRRLRIVN